MQLHIHGGPHSMYGVGFNFGWQEHAANGYVILYTNPRGSTGYGSSFGNQIMRAYPSKDFDDLMAGVDEVLKKGFVDRHATCSSPAAAAAACSPRGPSATPIALRPPRPTAP